MRALRVLAIFSLMLAAPLWTAGCVECLDGPPVTARDIQTAGSDGGSRLGTVELDVMVIDGTTGAPVDGAGVVFYWARDAADEWQGPRVEVGPDRVIAEVGDLGSTVEARDALRLMSDSGGRVSARVPADRIIGIVAARDDMTEEWLPAVATPPDGQTGAFELPLFPREMVIDMPGTWGPGGASSAQVTGSDYEWQPRLFAADEDLARAVASRLVEASVTLTWNNGPSGGGDLAIGVGNDPDVVAFFHDDGDNVALGTQTETLHASVTELAERGLIADAPIYVGPATKSGFLAPGGLSYGLHIEARLDTATARAAACGNAGTVSDDDGTGVSVPAPGAWAALVGIAAAAVVLARADGRRRS